MINDDVSNLCYAKADQTASFHLKRVSCVFWCCSLRCFPFFFSFFFISSAKILFALFLATTMSTYSHNAAHPFHRHHTPPICCVNSFWCCGHVICISFISRALNSDKRLRHYICLKSHVRAYSMSLLSWWFAIIQPDHTGYWDRHCCRHHYHCCRHRCCSSKRMCLLLFVCVCLWLCVDVYEKKMPLFAWYRNKNTSNIAIIGDRFQ